MIKMCIIKNQQFVNLFMNFNFNKIECHTNELGRIKRYLVECDTCFVDRMCPSVSMVRNQFDENINFVSIERFIINYEIHDIPHQFYMCSVLFSSICIDM